MLLILRLSPILSLVSQTSYHLDSQLPALNPLFSVLTLVGFFLFVFCFCLPVWSLLVAPSPEGGSPGHRGQ